MDQLLILITPGIRKPFTKNSSSLILPWRPHGHFTSMADATRMLWTVRGTDLFTDEKYDP